VDWRRQEEVEVSIKEKVRKDFPKILSKTGSPGKVYDSRPVLPTQTDPRQSETEKEIGSGKRIMKRRGL